MKTADAIKHFGGANELAAALGVTRQAVSQWGEQMPVGRAYQVQVLTGGKLRADPKAPAA